MKIHSVVLILSCLVAGSLGFHISTFDPYAKNQTKLSDLEFSNTEVSQEDLEAFFATDCSDLWEFWKEVVEKDYKTEEEDAYRFKIFCSSWDTVRNHNSANHSWSMDLLPTADMSPQEWSDRFTGGFRVFAQPSFDAEEFCYEGQTLPPEVNWAAEGHVTRVKNQGKCGSCWSFSTTGAIEGRTSIANDERPVSLSEQELVDCSSSFGDHGCDGGMMDFGFDYVAKNGGLCTESAYPYKGVQGQCRSSTCKHVSPIRGHKDVQPGSEKALMAALAEGPVSIAIEADQAAFQFYRGGIMHGSCGRAIDHGVLLVGYGHDEELEMDYWLVKNSWGPDWGEKGFIRLVRNPSLNDGFGQCGILSTPSFPIV